ncbi:hypothetical protein HMPREF9129_1182, partial [Peptoniphilus indolicus ATCC 29427]
NWRHIHFFKCSAKYIGNSFKSVFSWKLKGILLKAIKSSFFVK